MQNLVGQQQRWLPLRCHRIRESRLSYRVAFAGRRSLDDPRERHRGRGWFNFLLRGKLGHRRRAAVPCRLGVAHSCETLKGELATFASGDAEWSLIYRSLKSLDVTPALHGLGNRNDEINLECSGCLLRTLFSLLGD